MIYDISVPILQSMHVWPSDPPIQIESHSHISKDESHRILVTSIKCNSHTGTHLDAPSHMIKEGKTLNDLPLEGLVGPARVVEITGVPSIRKEDLSNLPWEGVERVLFKTDNSSHWQDKSFYKEFVYLEPEAAEVLVEKGLRLIGIDYLSIDSYGSKGHPTHLALLTKSIVILEGVNLKMVPPGDYELLALPIKLQQADGAPVRAILRN